VLAVVVALNLAYFGVEFGVALAIDSVALFADSVDFLEDASLNVLILMALGWTAVARARLGMVLAALLLVPAGATLWTIWGKLGAPAAPDPVRLSLTGAGALAVNFACAWLLARWRARGSSLVRAAFLSARNDVLANAAIIAAGLITSTIWRSLWPDLLVGLGIMLVNAGAAREVWEHARAEHRDAASAARA
jgi:Co/Zn/Cd efflux system component